MTFRLLLMLFCLLSFGLHGMVKIQEDKKTYALRLMPKLTNMLKVELKSFLNAHAPFFNDLNELMDTQDADGNTLLHRVILHTDHVDLLCYLVKLGASLDIPNVQGKTVKNLLNESNPVFMAAFIKATTGSTLERQPDEPYEKLPQQTSSKRARTSKSKVDSPPARKRIYFEPERHVPIFFSDASNARKLQ